MTQPPDDGVALREQAVSDVAAWLLGRDAAQRRGARLPLSSVDAEPTLQAALSPVVRLTWEAGLRRTLGWTGGLEEEADDDARRLLFDAAVRIAVSAQDPFPLNTLREAWHHCADVSHAPGRAVAEAAGPEAVASLLQLLATQIDQLRTTPRAVVLDERGIHFEASPRWASRAFWSGNYDAWPLDNWLHVALQALAPGPYFVTLGAAPKSYVHGVLARPGAPSFDTASRFLRLAPPAFDDLGGPAQGVVAFAALERLEAALAGRFASPNPAEPATALSTEASAATAEIAQILAARPDAPWLGLAWLQRLITLGRRHTKLTPALRLALIQSVAEQAPPSPDPWPWVDLEDDIWRCHRVLTQALVRVAQNDPVGACQVLAEGLASGRVTVTGRKPDPRWDNAESRIVGKALAAHPAPAQWFRDLMDATYEARARLRIGRNISFDNPGHVALSWAAHGVAWLGATPAGADLWRAAAAAAAECEGLDRMTNPESLGWSAIAVLTVIGLSMYEHDALTLTEVAAFMDDLADVSLGFCRVMGTAVAFSASDPMGAVLATSQGERMVEAVRRATAMASPEQLSQAMNATAHEALKRLM